MKHKTKLALILGTTLFGLASNANAGIIPNWHADFGNELTDLTDEDDEYEEVDFAAEMNVYGQGYASVYVNTNGSLNFDDSTDDYSVGTGFETQYGVSIAAFWSDLDPSEDDDAIIYQNSGLFSGEHAYIFTWYQIPDYDDNDLLNTFQAIITESGDIQLNFLSLDGIDPDADPEDGVVGISNGDELSDYETMDNWTFPRSEFSIAYSWDRNNQVYTRTEWDWLDPAVVPEPSSIAILGLGLLGLAKIRKNKK